MVNPVQLILYVAGGGLVGFLYYKFIGCATGTCPLTSQPIPAILYGALIGALLGMK